MTPLQTDPPHEPARGTPPRGLAPDSRRLPVGAEVLPEGGAHFRVWAPRSTRAGVELISEGRSRSRKLARETGGYFSGFVPDAHASMDYQFRLDSGSFPDPASRFQPKGPHGPSRIIDPGAFAWTDSDWRGAPLEGQVIYELHVGTFTREGTWGAAQEQLPALAALGVTLVEIMPVADFPGRFGWGYDGVNFFAPTRLYGEPDKFRAFVDAAHAAGVAVILDVVYNHFGPDGNYLGQFSEDYRTSRYANEWGEAINFDGPNSGPVREFILANAGYWIDEFHLDGLRLDATQQMFDTSPDHIIAAVARKVRESGRGRSTYVVAESELQLSRLVRPLERGGFGVSAVWNDDFHHSARVAATGKSEAYYMDYRGRPQEFISTAKWGYLFQGQWYSWQQKPRGDPALDLHPAQFVNYLQNHDQVANSMRGSRLHQVAHPGVYRALTALLLLGPGTPLLFQGQEFAASAPFLYFADHKPELARLVSQGRKKFLAQFPSIACAGTAEYISDPESESTFLRCKLDFAERESHGAHYRLHEDLLKLRRQDPVFGRPRPRGVDGAVLGEDAFALRFFGEASNDRLLLVNLGRDLRLAPAPEPLLAPVEGRVWRRAWCSEDPRYGGSGACPPESAQVWTLPGFAAVVLATG